MPKVRKERADDSVDGMYTEKGFGISGTHRHTLKSLYG